jgi:hypothetical protein
VGEPIAVSATLYRIYRTCPQQALGRLQGVYQPESVPLFRGSLAHLIFARHLNEGPIPDQEFTTACRKAIGSELNPKLDALQINKPSTLAPIVAQVGDLYARFQQFPTDGFRAAEVTIEKDVGGAVVIRGRVDAVFDDPDWGDRIVDWKTGADLDDVTDQLEFYGMAWTVEHGRMPGRVEAVSVPTGERVGIEPTAELVAETAGRVAEMVGRLREALTAQQDLERLGGPWCRFCPLLDGCREGKAAVALVGT